MVGTEKCALLLEHYSVICSFLNKLKVKIFEIFAFAKYNCTLSLNLSFQIHTISSLPVQMQMFNSKFDLEVEAAICIKCQEQHSFYVNLCPRDIAVCVYNYVYILSNTLYSNSTYMNANSMLDETAPMTGSNSCSIYNRLRLKSD